MATIKFCGASGGEVTGSKHLIKTRNGSILLDCGLFQGKRAESIYKNTNFPFSPSEVDATIISHAHIDHTGSLPVLVKNGFNSRIFLTPLTRELSYIMLTDSQRLMEEDAKFYNKIHRDEKPIKPLYNEEDLQKTFQLFTSVERYKPFEPVEDVKVKFINAGHVLGSSSILIETEGKKILYSGDVGRRVQLLLKEPDIESDIDYLIIETTYGDREHGDIMDVEKTFADIINRAITEKSKIIIPGFSLERTQELIYVIDRLKTKSLISNIDVYIDSPMSVKITDIFNKNINEVDFSDEFKNYAREDTDPFGYGYIKYISTVDESKSLNEKKGPVIIISASGMCEGGRILHHIRNSIDDEKNVLLLVGYQAANTLGRRLKDGAKKVKIFGLEHDVNFQVKSIDFFSSHAARSDLLNYVLKSRVKKGIFLVHGEENARLSFKELLLKEGFGNVFLPGYGEEFEI